MARTHGRCPVGERLVMAVPHGHWQTTTFVAALGVGGLSAPTVVDGAMTGELFEAYVAQQLAPALEPGDVVVMDNLSAHKVAAVRAKIEAVGSQLLYLPPYSPDFNPIEKCWAKIKQILRSLKARTVETLDEAITQALACITPENARGWFQHCGYQITQNVKTV